jgi:hypothetical protein
MRIIRFTVFLLVCLFGFGCSVGNRADSEHIHLFTAGPILVDVDAFAGDVVLRESEGHIGTSIEIRRAEATPLNLVRSVSWIQCSAYIEHHDFGQEVVVKLHDTEELYREKHAQIIITTSGITGIEIKTRKGNIDTTCGSIPMDIETSDGDIFVAVTQPMTESVAIKNKRGDIFFNVLPDSSGNIDATAIGGESVLDALVGHTTLLSGTTKEHLLAKLNDGTNSFVLRTVDGDILMVVTNNPRDGWSWSLDDWLPF